MNEELEDNVIRMMDHHDVSIDLPRSPDLIDEEGFDLLAWLDAYSEGRDISLPKYRKLLPLGLFFEGPVPIRRRKGVKRYYSKPTRSKISQGNVDRWIQLAEGRYEGAVLINRIGKPSLFVVTPGSYRHRSGVFYIPLPWENTNFWIFRWQWAYDQSLCNVDDMFQLAYRAVDREDELIQQLIVMATDGDIVKRDIIWPEGGRQILWRYRNVTQDELRSMIYVNEFDRPEKIWFSKLKKGYVRIAGEGADENDNGNRN